MAELIVVRHGQASFGAGDAGSYDRLSDLGRQQAVLAGDALRAAGWLPDRLICGTLDRQRETLAAMGFDGVAEEHSGWNEYDFHDLLAVRFGGAVPDPVRDDRKTHFRTLREVILDWQGGGLVGAAETYAQFARRVEAARAFSTDTAAERVLVVSSGGAIGQLVATSLKAPPDQMIALNLQIKNTSMSRFIFAGHRFFLHEFNTTPQFVGPEAAKLLTYS
ncbi:histidine phosphatase family protein [Pseudodonghicola xiamenensis]|uniref:Phosphoglycerate mutase n=1 Tax=Pseudodonghicola xiamenensis TaxID=337702 RepID=A0A8J3H3E6_9RHOB|nr:histidine phosphatase family protein [Pseudodonghicola xiamenensis]GHG81100.1 phosphoglycerate mutase [Pseudodonghicola xiamenensis]